MGWELDESSGFLTEFRGTITDSYAGTDPKYMDGEVTLVHWEVDVDEVLQEDYDGEVPESVTLTIPVGGKWYTEDGTTLEHPKGKDRFHASTIYGKLIGTVSGVTDNYGANAARSDGEPLEVDFGDLGEVLEGRGDPEDTAIWKGLSFTFTEVRLDYGENRRTGEKMVSHRTLPVIWHPGEDDGAKAKGKGKAKAASKPAAKKAGGAKKAAGKKAEEKATSAKDRVAEAKARAAAKRAAEAEGDEGEEDGDNPFTELVDDPDLAERLNEALDAAEDQNAFIDACLSIPEVASDDELLERLISDDGPWASKQS